jgi:hypothetical protein
MPYPDFFAGTLAAGFAVCALFFLRFWTRTKDGLFAAFALAFLLLAICQALTVLLGLPQEERSWIYILRFVAFSIVIIAVLQKNLRK